MHAENGGNDNETYQSLVDTLFESIRIVESHQERKFEHDTQVGALYSGEKNTKDIHFTRARG